MEDSDKTPDETASPAPSPEHEELSAENRPMLYIGLGASAGGLEALREFFSEISVDTGCAFVVVQHLSPDYKSIMDELLSRNTSMPVEAVTDGVEVKPNAVYLIPPRKNMLLVQGRLYLSEQPTEQGVNLPIDVFFRSLAEDARQQAVAIVLSGTGSDGSRGIRSVKESGGLVLVQDPDSSKFDGMPFSAVHTGLADFVLSPSQLAGYLESYVRHPLVSGIESPIRSTLESNDDVQKEIFTLLRKHSDIDFSYYKPSTVARRIERRMGINQIHELHSYLAMMQHNDKEVHTLARELLINVTRFFRGTEAFEYLEKRILPSLVENTQGDAELRVWIAGCSTGEEAYSIAMLLDEAIGDRIDRKRIKIFATDLDASAIAEASLGRYSIDIEADVSPARLARYFDKRNEAYLLRQEIRQMVVFATHNMITDPPFSNIDLVCCRNVLIYFQHAIQQKVIAAFHFSLKKQGMAFFGASESVGELKTHFETIHEKFRIFRKRNNTRVPMISTVRSTTTPGMGTASLPTPSNLLRNFRPSSRESLFEHVKDSLINDHVPACVVLDTDHHAVHLYGEANKYLTRFPAGRVSTNVHDIIDEQLAVAVGTALTRAESEGKPVFYSNINAQIGGKDLTINLQTEFFPEKNGKPSFFVLTLDETGSNAQAPSRSSESFNIAEQTQQRIRDLETELLHNQEHLQVTNEELETTNEELQSANEELMSSNEELQSANEELQSVNEELFTVNNEYQEKINELSVANDDLDNVLSFTSIGIIIVDGDMRIRKFTQVSTRYFNLLPTDIGRPLHHISNDMKYPDLFDDIDAVIRDQDTRECDVHTQNDDLLEVKLVPYLSSADGVRGRRLGAIVTLTDLSSRMHRDQSRKSSDKASSNDGAANDDSVNESDDSPRILVFDTRRETRNALVRQLRDKGVMSARLVETDTLENALSEVSSGGIDLCLAGYDSEQPLFATDLIESLQMQGNRMPVIVYTDINRDNAQSQIDSRLQNVLPSLTTKHLLCGDEIAPRMLDVAMRNALITSDNKQ